MGKIIGQTGLYNLDMATSLEGKLNSNQLLTWRGMGSARLFLLKTCYTTKSGYRIYLSG